MSFIRSGYPMKYVDGVSEDYIYPTERKGKDFVEDYGGITKEGLVEILCRVIDASPRFRNETERKYFREQLAEKLDVKLRSVPLTDKQWLKIIERVK